MEKLYTKNVKVKCGEEEMSGRIDYVKNDGDVHDYYEEMHSNALKDIDSVDGKFIYLINQRTFLMKTIMSKKRLSKIHKMSLNAGIDVLFQMIKDLYKKEGDKIVDEKLNELVNSIMNIK